MLAVTLKVTSTPAKAAGCADKRVSRKDSGTVFILN
jgi:hypothetical protein